MDLTPKQEYWKTHIDALDAFEGSTVDYARLHDLDAKKLYVFKTALRKKAELVNGSGFVQVKNTQTLTLGLPASTSVILPNGVRLSLPNVDQPGLLERLARL
jgi:hypothetical protein